MIEYKNILIIAILAGLGIALFFIIKYYIAYRKAKQGFEIGLAVAEDERTQMIAEAGFNKVSDFIRKKL